MFSKSTLIAVSAVISGLLATSAPALAADTEQVLYSFSGGTDGTYPGGALVLDSLGNLYGTAGGGANGLGEVFELSPAQGGGWTETVIYSFCPVPGCADGSGPNGPLIFDSMGNLYGTARDGGSSGCGVVFELSPVNGAWTESVLYSFATKNGCTPESGVIQDSQGNLYGTASAGGAYNRGAVFELTAGTWTEMALHSFHAPNSKDGTYPETGLVMDANGNLYGVTYAGGNNVVCSGGCGIAYELSQNGQGGWTEVILHDFKENSKNGYRADSALILDQAGNLYGTAADGASNLHGTVFELSPSAKGVWTETILHSFTAFKGGQGPSGLVMDAKGNLYGATNNGGNHIKNCGGGGCGLVFKLTPSKTKWTDTVLFSFNGKNGARPDAAMIFDGAGNLYGITGQGGSGSCDNDEVLGCGTVFEIKR
jgi:uncharacterized repeat protein (TIGR03803 family)